MKNFKLKIIISVYVSLIFLALYNSFNSYYSHIRQEKDAVFSKLSTISNIIGSEIDGDLHEKLIKEHLRKDDIKKNSESIEYKKIHQILLRIKKSSGISSPIYTLFPSNNYNQFYFGVTSSVNPYFRHMYNTPPKDLTKNYKIGGLIDEYKDENGIWLSSFSPIKNSNNEVVAVVEIDVNFSEFISKVNNELIETLLFILFIYSIIGFLLYLFLKEILTIEEKYIDSQKKYNSELENQVSNRTKELSKMNKKLLAVNKELESFFYSTSHDIRGPLCRILGLATIAKLEEDNKDFLELIEIESLKMDAILKKMILVNNIRTKDLDITEVSIYNSLSISLVKLKEKYISHKADVLIKTETQSLKTFHSDSEIIETIIYHLLDNAFKFSDKNEPEINVISSIDPNGILSLTISNNGIKISEDDLKHAFELFKIANQNEDGDGLRLGLYTIKTAIDKLNGIVEISVNDDKTEIRLLIPDNKLEDDIKELIEFKKTLTERDK